MFFFVVVFCQICRMSSACMPLVMVYSQPLHGEGYHFLFLTVELPATTISKILSRLHEPLGEGNLKKTSNIKLCKSSIARDFIQLPIYYFTEEIVNSLVFLHCRQNKTTKCWPALSHHNDVIISSYNEKCN